MKITALNKNYDKIATAFAQSRERLHWPEMDEFYQKIQKGQKDQNSWKNLEGLKLLDIGCGSGRFYNYLKNKKFKGKYIGIDQSEKLIKEAQATYPAVDFRVLDVMDIDPGSEAGMILLPEKDFNIVVSLAMWHHLVEDEQLAALKMVAQKMSTGAYFYLTVWNMWNWRRKKNWWRFAKDRLFLSAEKFYNKYALKKNELGPWKNTITLWQGDKNLALFYYAFTKRKLRNLFERAGFTVEKLEYGGGNFLTAQNIVIIAKKNN